MLCKAQNNRFSLPDFLHLVNSRCHSPTLAFGQYSLQSIFSSWWPNCQRLVAMVTTIPTQLSLYAPFSLRLNYVARILQHVLWGRCSWLSGLLIEHPRKTSSLQDTSDPWLFSTPTHESFHSLWLPAPLQPRGKSTKACDSPLGFPSASSQRLTRRRDDEEPNKVEKMKMISERLAKSTWCPLKKSPSHPLSPALSLHLINHYLVQICLPIDCPFLHRNAISTKTRILFIPSLRNPKHPGKHLAQASAQWRVAESMNECTCHCIFGVGSAVAVLYSPSLIKIAVNHIQHWWDMSLPLKKMSVNLPEGCDTILLGVLYVEAGGRSLYEN